MIKLIKLGVSNFFLTTITPNLAILLVIKKGLLGEFQYFKGNIFFLLLGQRTAQEGLQFGAAGRPEFGIFVEAMRCTGRKSFSSFVECKFC